LRSNRAVDASLLSTDASLPFLSVSSAFTLHLLSGASYAFLRYLSFSYCILSSIVPQFSE